jgi:23S rRNA pseudouridine1911/1915/1917 synthase
VVDRPIGPVPHRLLGSVHAASADGRPASSRIDVIERRPGAFLCDVRIATGRPHQIRIHLAATGHPLLGDPLYGAGGVPEAATDAVPGDPGYLLHAAEATLHHPRTRRRLVLTCAPPPPLRRANDAGCP